MTILNYRNWDVEFEMKDDGKMAIREFANLDEAKKAMSETNYDVCRILYKYSNCIHVWFGKKLQYVPKEQSIYAKQENIKKNLQKFAKGIREWRDKNEVKNWKAEYPKGIMAISQMKKNTGSLNFGRMEQLRNDTANSNEWKQFCEQNGITNYNIETTSFGDFIIRIHY